jgi:DNA-binding transcriptional regulator YiaG
VDTVEYGAAGAAAEKAWEALELERRRSLSREIGRCRRRLRLSQIELSRLLNMKLHRLSDLEKARSLPTAVEEERVRRRLRQVVLEIGEALG